MTNAPSGPSELCGPAEGAADDEFKQAIAAFKPNAKGGLSLAARLFRFFYRGSRDARADEDRHVAFDGYRGKQHDAKQERDRRYGTVYKVMESDGTYLVRLELPRWLPVTSLNQVWDLGDARPAYDYTVQLDHNVVAIQARLHGEALRRLAYVSPSYPSGFLTRIELAEPVARLKHRLRDQTIEVIVFKGVAAEEAKADRGEPDTAAHAQ
jgi:hypothetical protein